MEVVQVVSALTEWVVGVDIGGTFTDGFAMSEQGEMFSSKVPTRLDDRAAGAHECVEALAEATGLGVEALLASTVKFAHGQTATVNAMVQRRGARTGLIATRGFGDVLAIMNVSRSAGLPYHEVIDQLRGRKPEPLIPRELTEEVTERVDFAGTVVAPLDRASVVEAVERLIAKGVEAIAVSLLWSFRNPAHELLVREVVEELSPGLPVTLSSEIAPVMGEYERTLTTAANAYLAPALEQYVFRLQDGLEQRGLRSPALIMQSNGGLIPAQESPKVAVTTLVSGLAGGVMGSLFMADLLGIDNVITTDMGGTSFEVSLVVDGQPVIANYPLAPPLGPYIWRWKMAVPTIDITAIGSGGGSIAWLNGDVLKVGPISAQADPGPACYGRGGTEPTITDADLVLGYLNPDFFLGGRMKVDKRLAEEAIRTRIAEPLGIGVVEAARGIVEVANNQMADLVRHLTVNKGHDPRDFHVVAFGGAGPLHVGHFGPELGVKGMVVPGAGLAAAYSALGVALADYRQVLIRSDSHFAPFDPSVLEAHFQELELKARETFGRWGVADASIKLLRSVDMRYRRQIHIVEVPVDGAIATDEDAEAIVPAFESIYEAYFGAGTAVPEAGVEITTLRVTAIAATSRPTISRHPDGGSEPDAALKGTRDVFIMDENDFVNVEIYDGHRLGAGNRLQGPCVIEYSGSTIFLHPNQVGTIDGFLNCVISVAE